MCVATAFHIASKQAPLGQFPGGSTWLVELLGGGCLGSPLSPTCGSPASAEPALGMASPPARWHGQQP